MIPQLLITIQVESASIPIPAPAQYPEKILPIPNKAMMIARMIIIMVLIPFVYGYNIVKFWIFVIGIEGLN